MKRTIFILSIAAISALLGGCASTGLTSSSHRTNVVLNNNNYRVVAHNVVGEASSEAFLGLSIGAGSGAAQLSLIPVTPDRTVYKNAVQDLWSNFEATNGSPVDRTLALVNLRYDSETLNTVLYTKLTVAVIADVVEFE